MLIGLIVVVGLSLLVLGHEAGHFFAARILGMRVDEFGIGFPPRMFSRRRGETEYSVNWLPFGGFVRIAGEDGQGAETGVAEVLSGVPIPDTERWKLFSFQSSSRRALVILAGVAANFIIGWLLFSAIFLVGTPRAVLITDVRSGSPAKTAGILSGDVILGFDSGEQFSAFVGERRGQKISVRVLRGSEELEFSLVPRVEVREGEGPIGIAMADTGVSREPPLRAIVSGAEQAGRIFAYTFASVGELFFGLFSRAELPGGVAGPVGIFVIAHETGQLGLIYLVQLLAFISINLSVINLFPFPALDGGRFLLIVLEKLKGAPVSLKTQSLINGVGFALLLFLIFSITVSDVAKLLWT